ncbi:MULTISPECIES: tryptophan--tRNA ligase [Anaerotruncus]|uniref:Tryptophan--tRNA ligase n=2 Tax=Anaerotruncus TaxID=244127 RepID=A0A498CNJ2_9FIRM|nr:MULTISPECIES: tryptophan--tRNA ligase [Anaerotruncus]MBC3939409.1 tryptophan--tRNA ligase [Anaerotruncus massiliensis (ex Togo et al. 2019)]MCQ4896963.1 tryptophan--tRNA ligase [Anaerotruncus sp. DFI.9.16]RLL09082.1 tryptophan--tRNA ligase [Anaerotruncus massiliensis (ex Liu et al. 2021)]
MEQTAQPKPERRQRIFSGIQPTGIMTLGNYLGAIKNWVALQDEYDCVYSVVNMHAITVRQDPKALRENTLAALALVMACGIDPEKSVLFIQSHVKTHAELSWVLSCNTQFGELSRMTQFKDKSAKHPENVNAGLFTYPVLMAADILLYQADLVPVGIDQKQHLELARNIAQRFNGVYGNVFTLPDGYIPKLAAKVMSLQEPTKKMSKSDDNPKAFIGILDKPETIVKKFRSAVTDSEAEVVCREGKDGINNLLAIYSAVTGRDFPAIEAEFAGRGYGDFKTAVGEAVAETLRPVREQFDRYMADKAFLEECYRKGAARAEAISQRTLDKVYKKIGFLAK